MDILIVGSGAREHALAWKLKESKHVGKIFIAPGNAGTAIVGENVALDGSDFSKLALFASDHKIGLTIVGPGKPLADGIVDFFKWRGLRIWGPVKAAAQIESSKAFGKQLMKEAGIPTAQFDTTNDIGIAMSHVRRRNLPLVIKASGSTRGQGTYIC